MKQLYVLLLLLPFSIRAQTYVTMSAGSADNRPSSACLACAGAEWNNFNYISAADGQTVDVSLTQNPMCFQSTCYVSRYLYAYNFGFNIPITATIDSIFVDVVHSATTAGSIRDSVMQLYKITTLTGNSHPDPATWPTTAAMVSYGHNDPLWGTSWVAADLNDTNSGVMLKVQNLAPSAKQAHVDHLQMTVWYTTITGTYSVTSSPNSATWINTPGEIALHFFTNANSEFVSKVYDMQGQLVQTENGICAAGENNLEFPAAHLSPGVYFWRVQAGDEVLTRKISLR